MGNSSTGKKTTTTTTTPTKKKDSSGEFQKINMPEPGKTSPTVETEMLANSLAASGVLVSPLEGRGGAAGGGAASGGRRIVKAALKSPTTTTATTAASTGFQSIQDNDDDDEHQQQQHGHHLPPVMSPSASSEMLGESLDKSKTKMLDSTRKHQKTSRDKAIEEKRRKNKTGGGGDDVKSKPQANPFSRFLSAFSVDAARPDHKRPYEIGSSDEELDESSSGHHHDDATNPDGAGAGENTKKDDNSITTKKRMKLDGSQPSSSSSSSPSAAAASNEEVSSTASTTVVSIGGYDIDLTPVTDWIGSMIPENFSSSVSSATSELPPWVGPTTVAVGAAAAVAGVAMIITSMVRKK